MCILKGNSTLLQDRASSSNPSTCNSLAAQQITHVQEYLDMIQKGGCGALLESQVQELKELLEEPRLTVSSFRKMADIMQKVKDGVRSQKLVDIEKRFCAARLSMLCVPL